MSVCNHAVGRLQVLESVWVVVCGNMALIISILTSTVSVVFGGGTAILNFVLSAVSHKFSCHAYSRCGWRYRGHPPCIELLLDDGLLWQSDFTELEELPKR